MAAEKNLEGEISFTKRNANTSLIHPPTKSTIKFASLVNVLWTWILLLPLSSSLLEQVMHTLTGREDQKDKRTCNNCLPSTTTSQAIKKKYDGRCIMSGPIFKTQNPSDQHEQNCCRCSVLYQTHWEGEQNRIQAEFPGTPSKASAENQATSRASVPLSQESTDCLNALHLSSPRWGPDMAPLLQLLQENQLCSPLSSPEQMAKSSLQNTVFHFAF